MAIFEPLFKTLNDAGVRYVVVGGLAVVLHGHARLTNDVDLIIDLEDVQAAGLIEALVSMGMQARLPVDPKDFAKQKIREIWVRDRGMQVFSMYDPSNPMRAVDIFANNPLPFKNLWARAEEFKLPNTTVRVASIPDLIYLKRLAGRPQDLADIEQLKAIQQAKEGDRD